MTEPTIANMVDQELTRRNIQDRTLNVLNTGQPDTTKAEPIPNGGIVQCIWNGSCGREFTDMAEYQQHLADDHLGIES